MITYVALPFISFFLLCGVIGCEPINKYPAPKHIKCISNGDGSAECLDMRLDEKNERREFTVDPIPENWTIINPHGEKEYRDWGNEIRAKLQKCEARKGRE